MTGQRSDEFEGTIAYLPVSFITCTIFMDSKDVTNYGDVSSAEQEGTSKSSKNK